jgi:hypothetical protein
LAALAYLGGGGVAGGRRIAAAVDLPLHGRTPAAADQDFLLNAIAGVLADVCDRDTIPAATKIVTIDLGTLFFPFERPEEFATAVSAHWRTHVPQDAPVAR